MAEGKFKAFNWADGGTWPSEQLGKGSVLCPRLGSRARGLGTASTATLISNVTQEVYAELSRCSPRMIVAVQETGQERTIFDIDLSKRKGGGAQLEELDMICVAALERLVISPHTGQHMVRVRRRHRPTQRVGPMSTLPRQVCFSKYA